MSDGRPRSLWEVMRVLRDSGWEGTSQAVEAELERRYERVEGPGQARRWQFWSQTAPVKPVVVKGPLTRWDRILKGVV
jgi:hypothetical protein